jgi:hypothetical protein
MEKFTIINCHTEKYENDAAVLRNSLKRFNLNSQIELYKDQGDWNTNLFQKPKFIKQKLEELKSPVVWTDADSILLQYPELLNTLDCDVAIWRDWKNKISTGTIYFNYSEGAFNVLNHWIDNYIAKKPDGDNLIKTLQEIAPFFMKRSTKKDKVKIARLPHTYYYWHIDDILYKKLYNNEATPDLKELNIVFAHTRGYNRYFKSKGLK